jgi:hypothetical protein
MTLPTTPSETFVFGRGRIGRPLTVPPGALSNTHTDAAVVSCRVSKTLPDQA